MQSDCKLFIGGISWDTNEDHLKAYFGSFGEVLEAVVMRDQLTGRGRGFGFVVFADPAVVERVIQERHKIDGRVVEAKKAVPRVELSRNSGTSSYSSRIAFSGRTRKIFVGGLASSVTELDLRKYFEQFGTITDVAVMHDPDTLRPRGFGFITYNSEDTVDKVLLTRYHELHGKRVEVKRAVPKELSPGPAHKFSNLPYNGYIQEYGSSPLGGFGHGTDGRFGPAVSYQSGIYSFGSNHGINLNLEPALMASVTSKMMQGFGPYHIGNTNRLPYLIGHDVADGTNNIFNDKNLGPNGRLFGHNSNNSARFFEYIKSGYEITTDMGSSTTQPIGSNINEKSLSFSYIGGDNCLGLGASQYGTFIGSKVNPKSSLGGFSGAGAFTTELYIGCSGYGDNTWQSTNSERDFLRPFTYGLGNNYSDVSQSPGYVDGYSVTKRQPNRGIIAEENYFGLP